MKSLFRRSKKGQDDNEPKEVDAPPDHEGSSQSSGGRFSRKSRKSHSAVPAPASEIENSRAASFRKSQGQLSQATSEWGAGVFPGDPNYKGPDSINEDIAQDAPGPKKVEGQMSAEAKFMAYYQQKQGQKEPAPAPVPAPVAALSGDHLAEAAQEDEREQAREIARQEQRKVRENAEQLSKERREALLPAQKVDEASSAASTPKSEPMVEPAVDADEARKQRARQAVEDRKRKAREAVEARKSKAKEAAVNKEREAQGLPPIDKQAEDEEARRKVEKEAARKAHEAALAEQNQAVVEEEEAKRKEQEAQEDRLEKEKEEAARKVEEERVLSENQLARELLRDEQFAAKLAEEKKLADRKLEEEHARIEAVLAEEKRIADEKLRIEQERSQAALEEEKRMVDEQAFAIKALEDLKHQEAAEKEHNRLAKIHAAEKEREMFSMEKMAEMMNRGGRPAPAPEGAMVDGGDEDSDSGHSDSDDDSGGDDEPRRSKQSKPKQQAAPPQQQHIDPSNPFAAMAAMHDIQQAHAEPKAQDPPEPQARVRPKMPTGILDVEKGEAYDGASQDYATSYGDGGAQSGASPFDASLIDESEGDLSALLDREMDDSLDAALGLGNSVGSPKNGKSSFAKPDNEPKAKSTTSRRAKSDYPSKPVTGLRFFKPAGLRFFKPKTTEKSNGARTSLPSGQTAASAAPKKLAPTKLAPPKKKPTPPRPSPKKRAPPRVVVASPPKPGSPKKVAPPKVVSPLEPSRPPSSTPRQPNRDAFAFTPARPQTAVSFGNKRTGAETPSSFAKSPANSGRYSRSVTHKSPRHYPTSPARSTFSTMSACSDDAVDHLARSPHIPLGVDESAGPVCDNPYVAKLHETRGFCQVCIYHLTDSDKMTFEKNGRHLCVSVAYGGCLDCQVFPPKDEDDEPVRLCRKCFFDTHKLHKAKEEAFGGTGAMAGTVSSPRNRGLSSNIRR